MWSSILLWMTGVVCLLSAAMPVVADALPRTPQPSGTIEVLEPAAWRGAGTRGLVVQQRRTIRIVGLADHPSGIVQVTVNGNRAALQAEAGGRVRFTGYVPAEVETGEVEIAAYPQAGAPFTRSFRMTATPSSKVYSDATQAWGQETDFRGQRWAVVVGVSKYRDTKITPLRYADRDARAFFDFLTSDRAGLGGLRPENVRLLLNEDATYRNLRGALRDFLKNATDDDVIYIYFAGHGAPDPDRPQDLYLMTYDTEADKIASTAFPMEDVNDAIRRAYARNIIVITDACHSAGVGGTVAVRNSTLNQINRAFLDQLNSSTGAFVTFTASQANQYSQEDARWGGGHGVFTYFLLQSLDGAADEDRDRIVTLGEMIYYTLDKVRRETRNAQIPSVSQTAFDQAWPMSIVLPDAPPPYVAEAPAAAPHAAAPAAVTPAVTRPEAQPSESLGEVLARIAEDRIVARVRQNQGYYAAATDLLRSAYDSLVLLAQRHPGSAEAHELKAKLLEDIDVVQSACRAERSVALRRGTEPPRCSD